MRISDWSSDVCSSDLHAEVAAYLGLGVAAFLVAQDHHAAAIDAAQAADDGGVVGVGAVAGQLLELVADHADVVVGVRPRRMPRQLRDLAGRQVRSEEHTSELQSLMRKSTAVCYLTKTKKHK